MATSLEQENSRLKDELKFCKSQLENITNTECEIRTRFNKSQWKHEREVESLSKEIESLKQTLEEKDKTLKQQHTSMSSKKNSKGKLIEKKEPEDDKTVTEHQLRAYKRQVDDLRQTVESKKEEYEGIIKQLEEKAFEASSQIDTERAKYKQLYRQSEILHHNQLKLQQESLHYKELYEKSLNENLLLQKRLTECQYINPSNHLQSVGDQRMLSQGDHLGEFQKTVDESTRKADEALMELERMKINPISAPITTTYSPPVISQQASHKVYSDGQIPMGHTYDERVEDIPTSIPYDPNLVCPHCNKQFRFGEIQKLRLHINHECTHRDLDYH